MNKEQMIAKVSKDTGVYKTYVGNVVDSLLENIVQSLADGERVQFRGFGTFEMKERAERVARNPHSNEEIRVPAKSIPSFTPGYNMKNVATKIKN